MKIKYDISLIGFMSLFEKMTGANIKDCFVDDVLNCLTFIVQPGHLGRALGKGAVNVKAMQEKINRKIRIIEYNDDMLLFIKNMIAPLRVESIEQDYEGRVIMTGRDTKTKGLLIGRNAQNLRNLEKNVRRFFEVKEIKVI